MEHVVSATPALSETSDPQPLIRPTPSEAVELDLVALALVGGGTGSFSFE